MRQLIICIGNRFAPGDCAGLAVHDLLLARKPREDGVEIIEGGMAGLNLLPLLELGGRVVFVDAVSNMTTPCKIAVFSGEEIVATLRQDHFGHGAGLPYLLSVLPKVCEGELPEEILLVGIEGEYDAQVITTAAELSLNLARDGRRSIT